jgi:hypothetical protein
MATTCQPIGSITATIVPERSESSSQIFMLYSGNVLFKQHRSTLTFFTEHDKSDVIKVSVQVARMILLAGQSHYEMAFTQARHLFANVKRDDIGRKRSRDTVVRTLLNEWLCPACY